MRKSIKLLGMALVSALILASAVTAASARNLEVSNQNFRIVYSPLSFEAAATINCSVTLEGTFHYRTIVKSIGALIGYVTRAIVRRPCEGLGEAWAYTEREGELTNNVTSLPWHVTYEGFEGTLPDIRTIRLLLRGAKFAIQGIFGICLSIYGPNRNIEAIATRSVATGAITEVNPDNSRTYTPESNPGGECGAGRFRGRGTTTVLGSSTSITVRLI